MKIDRLQLVKLRNGFYKDGFRRMSLMLLLSMIINLILLVTVVSIHNKEQKPIYFAAGIDGKLKELTPVSSRVYTPQQIQNWISRVVPSILHLDFVKYRSQLLANKKYFTNEGWTNFNQAFEKQVDQIRDQRLVTSAIIPSTPAVTSEMQLNGVYSWYVQVPVKITFEGNNGEITVNQYVWQVLVQRVDSRNSDQLLGIRQVIVRDMGK